MAIATTSPPKSLTPRKVQNYSNNNNNIIHNDNSSVGTAAVPAQEPESRNSYRIWWSDIVVNNPKNVFVTNRKWEYLDIRALVVLSIMHVLVMFGPMTFSWPTFWVYVFLVLPTGFAIPLSYHRQLSHKSFKLPKWLEYFCAYLGVLAQQGDPIEWVSRHRFHHKFGDSERDPHSPTEGFWFSYMTWIFDYGAVARKCGEPNNVQDLEKQAFYRFLRSTYLLQTTAFGLLLYALGGFPYIVWGMGIRTITIFHMTFSVNAICHTWGKQAYNTGDLSRNNWWMAIATIGESWHNNHHAFEYSARHGLEWWEIDATWYTIKLLAALGLATDIKLPTEAHKQRLAFK